MIGIISQIGIMMTRVLKMARHILTIPHSLWGDGNPALLVWGVPAGRPILPALVLLLQGLTLHGLAVVVALGPTRPYPWYTNRVNTIIKAFFHLTRHISSSRLPRTIPQVKTTHPPAVAVVILLRPHVPQDLNNRTCSMRIIPYRTNHHYERRQVLKKEVPLTLRLTMLQFRMEEVELLCIGQAM